MRELERRVLLSVLDRKWREHLYEMDYLREGIYLRAYSQRDPLVEYQREGFDMFSAMMDVIKAETVGFLFNLEVQVEEDEERRGGRGRGRRADAAAGARRPTATARRRTSGPRASSGPSSPSTCRTPLRRRPARSTCAARRSRNADDPYAGVGRNAAVPLRLGQEVQEVPRRTRRPDRPHRPRQLSSTLTRQNF